MKTREYFLKKQNRLLKARKKVQDRLQFFAENWRELPKKDLEIWNNWHDLEKNLENRLQDNYSSYLNWHFEKYGWSSIG